jgi:hypothetical protein
MKSFIQYIEQKETIYVLQGNGTPEDSLYALNIKTKKKTFLDPGNWLKNIEQVDDIYKFLASYDQGKSWFSYISNDKPVVKPLF